MQFFELVLILITSTYIGFSRRVNKEINKYYVLGLLIFVLIIQLLFNGYRWQMVPAYLLWLIALITALRQSGRSSSIIARISKAIGLLILFALSIILPILLPVFKLPQATGPYSVGTRDIYIELDREEVITADKTDKRRFMVKAWYPTNVTSGEEDLYVDQGGRNGFAQKYGLPPSMLNYLNKVETGVYRNIEIADETFPVLIFSHGYNSKANGYYALLTELVSQGYVVFAINHTYESTGTTFPDGTEAYFDYDYAGQIEAGTWEKIEPAIQTIRDGLSFEEQHPLVQKALSTYFVIDIIERWTFDIVDVVNKLDEWNKAGFFKDRLDVSNVGVFGHSRGGGAAGESLLVDSRIKAGANLDGVQWGQIVDTMFQKPFLFLSSDWPSDHEDLNSHAYVNKSSSFFYEGTILQSGHSNFMDIPYMIPLQALNQAGEIDPDLAIEIASKVTTSFFDRHLKNIEVDLSILSSEYEMLDLNVFKGDSVSLVGN